MLDQWCQQWSLQASDPEDTAHETLLILLQVFQNFEFWPDATFRDRMRLIAQNAWYRLISHQSQRRASDDDALTGLQARDDLVERFAAMGRQELLERAKERVQRRIAPLAWSDFVLTCLDPNDCAEVAHELGRTVGNRTQDEIRLRIALHPKVSVRRLEAAGHVELVRGPATVDLTGIDAVSETDGGPLLETIVRRRGSNRLALSVAAAAK